MNEWNDRSFLIEFKPRAEYANLFVDCPPPVVSSSSCLTGTPENAAIDAKTAARPAECSTSHMTSDQQKQSTAEVVKVGEHVLELRQQDQAHHGCFAARMADLILHPETICGLTWADHHRLFMCKLHVETEGMNLAPKTFRRLANDIANCVCLDEYADDSRGQPLNINCSSCQSELYERRSTGNPVQLLVLPDDDWLEVTANMEFYCRDVCSSHQHQRSSGSGCEEAKLPQQEPTGNNNSKTRWLPNEDRISIANSFTLITNGIWLLESYVVLTNGNLSEEEDDDSRPTEISDTIESATDYHNGNVSPSPPVGGSSIAPMVQKDEDPNCNVDQSVHSFPALKMLYKVFDANSAVSDPRVNGQDASVSIVELPSGACLRLTEILLQSSHALPPACRSVGQFFVGFLKLKDTLV